jgi:hypothetical protein
LSKKTTYVVAARVPGDTCHLPPQAEAAGPAAVAHGGMSTMINEQCTLAIKFVEFVFFAEPKIQRILQ